MKPPIEPSHAEFGNAAHLLQALCSLRVDSLPFPARVVESGGRWRVPLHELGPRTFLDFQKTARQHGWDVKTVAGVPRESREVPLASLLGGQWRYVDPLTSRNGHGRMGDAPYLLAARDEAHAGRLLRLLTGSLVRGIAARPVLFTEGKHPFAFLWAITRGEPPLTLLQSAETAWWHPLRNRRGFVVYREWPYELGAVDDRILERIDWEDAGGLVLLRHDREPVIVQVPAVEPLLADLIEVAGFEAERCLPGLPGSPAVIAAVPAERSPFRFQVSLRLVTEPPDHTLARRITALKAEIQAKQSLVELLEEVNGEAALGGRWIAPEPLFLFYEEPGTVPFQLRRLLVEWVDQEKGLADLRYQKLSPTSLPPDLMPAGEPVEIHLLTTARALGADRPGLLGHRLRDYRPGQGRAFDLLPDWAGQDLRLFLPQGRHLALYPEIRATPLAAAKLARALLPSAAGTGDGRADWCALLLPAAEGQRLQAIPLRRDGFLPLTRAFEWDCALDVSFNPEEQALRLAGALAERLFATAGQDLQEAVNGALSARLEPRRDEFAERQKAAAQELAERTRVISELETRVSTARGQLAELTAVASRFEAERKALIQGLEILLPELAAEVSGMQALLADLTGALETVYRERESLLRSLEAVIRGTARVIGQLQRLVALVERLLGLTQKASALGQRWETLLRLSGGSGKA
jgi:hypothetical protein